MHPKKLRFFCLGVCVLWMVSSGYSDTPINPFMDYKSLEIDSSGKVTIELDNTGKTGSLMYEIYCSDESVGDNTFLSKNTTWRLVKTGNYVYSSAKPVFYDPDPQNPLSKILNNPTDKSVSYRYYAIAASRCDTDNDGNYEIINDHDGDNLTDAYEIMVTRTNPYVKDSDNNLIDDNLEDYDNDGLTNEQEYQNLTYPFTSDTDNDGLSDSAETSDGIYENALKTGTNPLNPDTDNDNLNDAKEILVKIFDGFESGDFSKLNWNFDGDVNWIVSSGNAKDGSFCATVPDSLSDEQRSVLKLTVEISEQHVFSFNYKVSSQTDKDAFLLYINNVLIMPQKSGEIDWSFFSIVLQPGRNVIEFIYQKDEEGSSGSDTVWIDNVCYMKGSNPNLKDSDGDGVPDDIEIANSTSALTANTDGDGLSDFDEIYLYKTNPTVNDTDGDGLLDSDEPGIGTDPNNPDTDGDQIPDGWEYDNQPYGATNPLVADSDIDYDNDKLTNYEEYCLNTYPDDPSVPQIVYVDNDGVQGGTGTQADPYHSLQYALDSTYFTDINTGNPTPAIFILEDGIYDLSKDNYLRGKISIDNYWLYSQYNDTYKAVVFGSSPDKVTIKGAGTTPAIEILYGYNYGDPPLIFKNLTITGGNKGVDIYNSSVLLVNCVIKGNTAPRGGGVFIEESDAIILNSLIYNNTSLQGAGIYIKGNSSPEIYHTTIVDNIAQQGIAVYRDSTTGQPLIVNSILWEENGDDISNLSSDMFRNCDIQDGLFAGENGNIKSIPQFASPAIGNYRITANSPCRNAGNAEGIFLKDVDAESRPANSACDIGYDEFTDADNDSLPDFWETLYNGDYVPTADDDFDNVTNDIEAKNITNPTSNDTDNDLLYDDEEILIYHTNPLKDDDADGDGIKDAVELFPQGTIPATDPHKADTDGDGMPDKWEADNWTFTNGQINPTVADGNADLDNDLITNYEEYYMGSFPDVPFLDEAERYQQYGDYYYDKYYVSTYGTIQAAINQIVTDQSYGTFVALLVIDVPGEYNEYVEMKPNIILYSGSVDDVNVRIPTFNNPEGKYYTISATQSGYYMFKNISVCGNPDNDGDPSVGGFEFKNRVNALLTNCKVNFNVNFPYLNTSGVSMYPSFGGGINANHSNVDIVNITMEKCEAIKGGGAIYADNDSIVNIKESSINNNSSLLAGAAIYISNSSINVENCEITDNKVQFTDVYVMSDDVATKWNDIPDVEDIVADGKGGAISIRNNDPLKYKAKFKNNIISYNTVNAFGAGIYACYTALEFDNDSISNNDNLVSTEQNAGLGGGIYADGCPVKLIGCDISNNKTAISGGGVYIRTSTYYVDQNDQYGTKYTGFLTVKDSNISSNTADNMAGGGIYIEEGKLYIENSDINSNSTFKNGAGIYSLNNKVEIITSNVKENNILYTMGYGGGLYLKSNTELRINKCTIEKNKAPSGGGGLYIKSADPDIQECAILSNSSNGYGAGAYIEDCDISFNNSLIKSNATIGSGGGIYFYASLDNYNYPVDPVYFKITNTIIKANSANQGGAIMTQKGCSGDILFSIIVDNKSVISGGGIFRGFPLAEYPINLINLVIWNNTDDILGFYENDVMFCNIKDGDFKDKNGNISVEPNFLNPQVDNYHLRNNSPLINMGTVLYSDGYDIDDEQRPLGTSEDESMPRPLSNASDIGLDEFMDSDNDSLPDFWENRYGMDLDNEGDYDSDNVNNYYEFYYDSDPTISDTDNDTIPDYAEIFLYQTNPQKNDDKDGDGLLDAQEIYNPTYNLLGYGTDPSKIDTDDDRLPDKWEIDYNLNPTVMDSTNDADNDDLTNFEEYFLGTTPSNIDSPAYLEASGYSSIQAAINAASGKTIIYIGAGTYHESIVLKSGISLFSTDPENTIISGDGINPAITVNEKDKCVIKNLIIKNGKKGIYIKNSSVLVIGCTIINNIDSGIYLDESTKNVLLINNSIYNNTGNYGGGLYCAKTPVEITNCNIYNNNSMKGGGIFLLYNSDLSNYTVKINNCNIVNNSSLSGGGIYLDGTKIDLNIINSNIWNNGDDLYNISSAMISYSNIEDGDFIGENHNISQDPKFGAPQYGQFNLLSNSPCINKGNNVIYYPVDIHKATRLYNYFVDIGTDEFVDTDNDGLCDTWENKFGGLSIDPSGDNDSDSITNIDEYKNYTNPNSNDTDQDGLLDNLEIMGIMYQGNTIYTNPNLNDGDGDGLNDGDELTAVPPTNPANKDTDNDGMDDYWEVTNNLSATVDDSLNDADNDGILNIDEYKFGSEPDNDQLPVKIFVNAGQPAPNNGTETNPYSKISDAIKNAPIPAVIIIKNGTYEEWINLNKDRIAIIGESAEGVIIKPTGTYSGIKLENKYYCIIKNLTVTNSYQGIYSNNSTSKIINCIFSANTMQPSNGAGLYFSSSNSEIIGCSIKNNIALYCGGGLYSLNSFIKIKDSSFLNNKTMSSTGSGGAIYCLDNSYLDINNCIIKNNLSPAYGAGLYIKNSKIDMIYTLIKENVVSEKSGGGIYLYNSSANIYNNTIFRNSAQINGGGIFCDGSSPVILHCVIVENKANSNTGGGIFINSTSNPEIKNSIFWNNTDDLSGAVSTMLANCDIKDGDFAGANGNISADPLFANIESDNFHIKNTSPCINSGALLTVNFNDSDGENRPYDSISDIGSDEYVDTDTDGLPDFWEIACVGNLTLLTNSTGDSDNDGLNNFNEFVYKTSPTLSDTDSDGLTDNQEIFTYNCDPNNSDTDKDGLNDGIEINTYNTNPLKNDSDDDFIPDLYEVNNSLNPNDASDADTDPDTDMLSNLDEYYLNTNPNSSASPTTRNISTSDDLQNLINNLTPPVKFVLNAGTYRQLISGNPNKYTLKSGIALITNQSNPAVITTETKDTIIYLKNISNVVLKNLVIKSGLKGVVSEASSKVLINNCKIESITATTDGGAIVSTYGDILVYKSKIYNNEAKSGAGIYSDNTKLDIYQSEIYNNFAITSVGGGLRYLSYADDGYLNIRNTLIYDNNANTEGGGIYCKSTNLNIFNSNIYNNKAFNNAGGIYLLNSNIKIIQSIIKNNFAPDYGAGIYCNASSPEISHSLILENKLIVGSGGGIYVTGTSNPVIKSSVFWNNDDDLFGIQSTMISHSDIKDGDFLNTNGNISADPQFIDYTKGDYHLKSTSPLINSGAFEISDYNDIDNEDRIYGVSSDIGVDEFADEDNDYLADRWELTYCANLTELDNTGDADLDNLSNVMEYNLNINPKSTDSDNDTLSDYDEYSIHKTNPKYADTDSDGLNDNLEIANSTNPNNPDSDGDCMPDGWEVTYGLNPNNSSDANTNLDSDYLTNYEEYYLGSLPNNATSPATINSSGYPKLQNAVNAAPSPGIVLVSAGEYAESLTLKSNLVLYSATDPNSDTPARVKGSGSGLPCIKAEDSTKIIIKNIKVASGSLLNDSGIRAKKSNMLITNCLLDNNTSSSSGGGIDAYSSTIEVRNSKFNNNRISNNGGGIYSRFSFMKVYNCDFTSNRYCSIYSLNSEFSIKNTELRNQFLDNGYNITFYRSALYSIRSIIDIEFSKLYNNKSSTNGAAVYSEYSNINIKNSEIYDNNSKTYAGGLYYKQSSGYIYNCIIRDNKGDSSVGGIGLYNNSKINILYSIILNNIAPTSGGGIYNSGSPQSGIKNSIIWNNGDDLANVSSAMISYSNIEDGDYVNTNGNISANPKFRNLDRKDFHLQYGSPCINKGIDPSVNIVDIDNEIRPDVTQYDMGIDEFVDSDCDGLPNFWENSLGVNIESDCDGDNDGISAFNEYIYLTSPLKIDTDNDGLTDKEEIDQYKTDPISDADKDLDGLKDNQEIKVYFTDYNNPDTDNDFMYDGWEIQNGFNPLVKNDGFSDFDNDGIANNEEYFLNTDPKDPAKPNKVFVDCTVATSGDGSEASPYKTIQNAFDNINVNNLPVMIVLAPGLYNEAIKITKKISIMGNSPQDTIIISNSLARECVEFDTVSQVILKNLTLKDSFRSIKANKSDFMVLNCILKHNISTTNTGGGVYAVESKPIFVSSIVEDNTAYRAGGGIYLEKSNTVIENCIVRNNKSLETGGGIFGDISGSLKISDSKLEKNSSVKGGGIYLQYVESNISSTVLTGNYVFDDGGGLYTKSTNVNISNTVFSNNRADKNGGGLFVYENIGNIENSVFVSNSSGRNSGNAIYRTNSNVKLKNSILWNTGIELTNFVLEDISNCDIKDGSFSGNGNICAEPLFVNPVIGDFHLFNNSPCINAGSITSELNDIDLEIRPYGPKTDIGIDEFIDSDCDGLPNYWESKYGSGFIIDGDNDSDNLTNLQEYTHSTNPLLSDTDNDGLTDQQEIETVHTNPLIADTDSDGINDGQEVSSYQTNPFKNDSDSDSMPDLWEVTYNTDPNLFDQDNDNDNDGISNYEEFMLESQPNNSSSPSVIYVDINSTAPGNGTQQNPYVSIQNAINNVLSSAVIDISAGTYAEALSITGNGGIILKASQGQKVIIKGNKNDSVISVDNAKKLVILKHLIIQDGKGGIYCTKTPLIVNGCLVKNNSGSGISLDENFNLIKIIDTVICNNTSSYGGGIWCNMASPFIFNTLIYKNNAIDGGGIWATSSDDFLNNAPVISHSNIIYNTGTNVGGIYIQNNKLNMTIRNSVIWGNGDDLFNISQKMISYCNVEDYQFGSNIISVTPGFGAPQFGKFHLISSSLMINKGGSIIDMITDFHGETRPSIGCDIGFDEFIDTDNDGLGDYWESLYGGNLNPNDDNDNDSVINTDEYKYFTNPNSVDSDGDNLTDIQEISGNVSDPTSVDTDEDGLNDDIEKTLGTNPLETDTDGDGISDKWEHDYGMNPKLNSDKDTDIDNDGISNYEEFIINSIPNNGSSPQFAYIDSEVDNEGDGTLSNPYKTITYALSKKTPPYIFHLNGIFKENLSISSDFIFIGANKTSTVIEAKISTSPAIAINSCNLAVLKNLSISKGKQVVSIVTSNVAFSNCIIKNSTVSTSSGGGIYSTGSNLSITDTEIIDNNVTLNGAGIYIVKSSLSLYNSILRNNISNYDGGGLYAEDQCSISIINSKFYNNQANHYGAGLTAKNSCIYTIINTIFAFNTATYSGGAIYNYGSIPHIENSVFYKNTRSLGQGSTLFLVSTSSCEINNSIFWSDDTTNLQEDFYGVNTSYISYCDIEDMGTTYNNNNNISIDPLLANPENYNFHLQETSPCINAGSDTASYQFDIDGETRPYDNKVDIGVDEFIPGHGGR